MRLRLVLLIAIGSFLLASCGPPREKTPVAKVPDQPADTLLEETWDAVFMDEAKVGHLQTRIEKVAADGRELRRITSDTVLTIERFGQTSTQKMSFSSLETPEGKVIRIECRITAGTAEIVVRGDVTGDTLTLVSETPGKTVENAIEWNASWGGFFAAEQSLRNKPLAAGESRELRALMPDFPFPSAPKMKLAALDVESTELLDGSRELLKIKQTIELAGGQEIESFVWTDKQGEVQKTQLVSGLAQTSYRTTKEVALGKASPLKFDLGVTTTVRVATPLKNAHQTKRVVYRAKLKEGDPSKSFVTGPSQTVRKVDETTAEIVVRAIRPDQPVKLESPDVPPTPDDLAPNSLIQSDDKNVLTLALGVARDEQDPWKLAVALERHVKTSMRETNFSQAFATAAETADSLEGDCTEHAMLLAAVCRARKLPARVAVGLVYDGKSGFVFHMWTEVWISDRWIPLDATRGGGGIGAAHLKLAHTNLKVSSITTALFPVFNVLGRLELEIVEAE